MSFSKDILDYISSKKEQLDDIIRIAAASYYRDHYEEDPSFFVFDIDECNRESLNLMNNKDLCYDRPGIGFSYSLWYHGRRVNTFVKYFAQVSFTPQEENTTINIFDLGAGTGAIQWAIGLLYCAMVKKGIKPPNFRVVNIDTSPFMLKYNRDYLWPAFQLKFPEASRIQAEFSVNSWSSTHSYFDKFDNPWIVASYLFDHSENKEEIKVDFLRLTERLQPSKVLLLTSNQPSKRHYLNEVATSLQKKGFAVQDVEGRCCFLEQ